VQLFKTVAPVGQIAQAADLATVDSRRTYNPAALGAPGYRARGCVGAAVLAGVVPIGRWLRVRPPQMSRVAFGRSTGLQALQPLAPFYRLAQKNWQHGRSSANWSIPTHPNSDLCTHVTHRKRNPHEPEYEQYLMGSDGGDKS
jgi:hypothetical protein